MPELRHYALRRIGSFTGLASSEVHRMMPGSEDGLVQRVGALAPAIAPVFMGLEVARTSLLMEAALLRLQESKGRRRDSWTI